MRHRHTTAHEIDFALPLISGEFAKRRESGLLDECAPEILRCAQDDKTPDCHPERSEGSLADLWVITGSPRLTKAPAQSYNLMHQHLEMQPLYTKAEQT